MKYTIELTENQKKRFKHMNKTLIKMGMGFDILSLLKPINVEDTNEYQIGYRIGYEKGKKCLSDSELERIWKDKLAKAKEDGYCQGIKDTQDALYTQEELKDEYDRGYTQAIADYRKFERLFNSEGIEVFEDIRNTDGTISIDMILQYLPMPEIMARIKAYEEKKKAEEEIKVGDEIKSVYDNKLIGIVTKVNCQSGKIRILSSDGSGGILEMNSKNYKRTGRNFSAEIGQLLDKLRGEEE